MENTNTPGARLKSFFETTSLSVRDFAAEIGHPEKYRTLYSVFQGKRDPSTDLVRLVIARWPQLNFDWIFVGSGDMLISGQSNMISSSSYKYSIDARVEEAMKGLDKIEFAMNELALQIERALKSQAEMTNIFFKKIDEMTEVSREQQAEMAKNRQRANELVDTMIQTAALNSQKVDQMLERSQEAQKIVDDRSADAIRQHQKLNQQVYDKLSLNGAVAERVDRSVKGLIKTVEENNKLQNKWEGHLVSLTGAAELINKMGGFSMSQKPDERKTSQNQD